MLFTSIFSFLKSFSRNVFKMCLSKCSFSFSIFLPVFLCVSKPVSVLNILEILWKLVEWCFNSLPKDKILDWSKLKAFTDDKINVTEKLKFLLERVETLWLPAFSPFPTMFAKGFLYRVIKSRDCVVELNYFQQYFNHITATAHIISPVQLD